MGNLFGTDGVRGIAYSELTLELATKLGFAAGKFLANSKGTIIIGRDTRGSGEDLEQAVTAGLCAQGIEVVSCGVIPTPAIAFLLKETGASGGIVISASHNPPQYNGIKFFNSAGGKLSDVEEAKIEDFVLNLNPKDIPTNTAKATQMAKATKHYTSHAVSTIHGDLSGLTVAIDCGHGAAYRATPEAFRVLGADVHAINESFTGDDINVNCGSTNLGPISELVRKTNADFGFAHDGDADRVLAVDENGENIDGDYIMAICARHLKDQGKLANDTVVTTVMANMGLDKAMAKQGIQLVKTDVGDRYVLTEMKKTGATFGGEQSGHIVFFEHNTTGDGLVTALQLAAALKESGKKMSELTKIMRKYPQVLINVPAAKKSELSTNTAVQDVIHQEEARLANEGRILVRPSGTEPLVRVMAEAATKEAAEAAVSNIVSVVSTELN